MTPADRIQRPSPAQMRPSFVAPLAICALCMLILLERRGLWLDEFWTVFLSRHDAPLPELFRTRWGPDVHPPLYTFYTWLLSPLTGTSKVAMRLTNMAGIAMLGAAVWLLRHRLPDRRFLVIFALLLAGSPFFVTYFAEYRSYFIELAGTAVVLLQLQAIHFLERDLNLSRDRMLAIGCLAGIPPIAAVHFTSGALILVFTGVACLHALVRCRRRSAALLAATAIIAVAFLASAYAVVLHFDPPAAPNRPGAIKGMAIAIGVALAGLAANPAALWFALAAARSPTRHSDEPYRSYSWALVAMLAAGVTAISLLNALSPFLAMRYAIALVPAGAALTAWLAREAADRTGRGLTLIGTSTAGLAVAITVHQGVNRRWETFAPAIARSVAACPATRVLALYSPYLRATFSDTAPGAVENNHAVFMSGYRLVGARYGFAVEEVPKPSGVDIVAARPCPVILWTEHNVLNPAADASALLAAGHIQTPAGSLTSLARSRFGSVLTIIPAS